MEYATQLEFDHEDRRRLYEHVEREGSILPEELQQRVLPHDPGGFKHHIAILKRNSYLKLTDDGLLEVALDLEDAKEEYDREALSFCIRPARQADLTGIVGAIQQVTQQGTYIEAESVAQEVDHQQALLRQNELESRMFFVATINDEVIGWVHIHSPELDKLAHTAELTVGVLEEYRSHGIGSHLIERGLEWAGSEGYEKVYQSAPSTNQTAIEFLQELGWEIEAVREDHYKIDGEYVDEVMMAVKL